uniref:RNase H type-1 domain-containing protein n=1 Tax=Hordeum vulgare subsp. vulgare TaxID=112509 RepID=A0A8I7BE80_HORVV
MVLSHQGKLTANQKGEVQAKDRVQRWTKPPPGWTKLNIDGAFSEGNKTGGAGMILRDEEGQVIFSSCHYLRTCSSALEAELAACLEGISIARAWSVLPMIVELDCSCAVQMIVEEGIDRSPHATLVMQLNQALGEIGEHVISHVVRSRNALADALARLGRINQRTAIWLRGIPVEVDTLCKEDSVG